MKKFLTMFFVLSLLLCAMALPIHAEETTDVNVYLDAPAQVASGAAIGVSLYVNGSTAAGGVQGTVTFDADQLEYTGVTLRDDVQALGNTEDVTVKADGTGVIEFVTISNVAGGTAPADAWLTVNFTVKMANAGDTAEVALSDVIVSDVTGTVRLTATTANTAVKVMVVGENDYVDMEGATIRTSLQNQGIRFYATPDDGTVDLSAITEVGVVMFPTKLLYAGQDLTKETIGKGGTTPAIASITSDETDKMAAVKAGETVFATLTNGTTGGRADVEISARAYVVVNGETIYSYNDTVDTAITLGAANKSLVGIARAIANKAINQGGAENTLGDILTTEDVLTDDEVIQLLTFCRDNIDKIPVE